MVNYHYPYLTVFLGDFYMLSALLIGDVPIECINQAAIQYRVPAAIIISVLNTEGGRAGRATSNTNGTYDYGPMQINTVWLKQLQRYGYSTEEIKDNPCTNVWAGTWILSQRTAHSHDFWYGVGSYNSYQSRPNYRYQQKVSSAYYDLISYLKNQPSFMAS
jgi:soluble lytic murein transglycosylase-like protein